ncbi:ribonuclease P protein subunit p30-like [Oppia nitens]|uniref:ribonuclease P protein subunit p30-like n=1 Tax=Oppia nitens TaxID=1686743 RepID=UPI0023DC7911|nr:ribonuclease P protein subunit p30-like [Oppia nitens]
MDLNVIIGKNKTFDTKQVIADKVKNAMTLGFRTIGLTVDVDHQHIPHIPIPPIIRLEDIALDRKDVVIKTRLNVRVEEHIQTHRLNQSENAKKYDLLSIEPLNDKMLSHLNKGNFDTDLITFNFSSTLCPDIKRSNFSIPISKGVGIEINYGNSLLDPTSRRSLFSLSQLLVEKTKSKNIVISSGSTTSFALRAPKDVTYLGLMFGLNGDQSKAAVFRNPILVLKHSEIRKNVNMGTISLTSCDLHNENKWLNKEFASVKRVSDDESSKTKKVKI